ncbi:MetQ/NlpA family ABC transporter substrate-binding protein [Lactococcus lactis]|uniref:Lipoprotein n=2 Tax=Lactococcus lactis TaxID=1358 RepID=A0A9X4NBI4_9LACT|nr:MetQ/NlpA family ABC transporter substrate-binding protein [Lactococcus lactis]ARE12637.1 MetQ/NlpA family ABC transporter substrate-binding protein [Lactococcus lactis subsp. lactis]ARE15046.1 MetQ/NlpA family ABC transporter substrate-binding protein [Lactococcus lactis subsp. lactis]MCT0054035.1 MetQ/NlpA family ABC transporter substrate-binding protein [Lactococcus lactis subsp. lactis]MDG4955195.1 MetQ/NlpA family ABC transporter substrate-binding protein [Lactococcus lactis]MDG4980609
MNPKNRNIIVALAVIIVVALVAFFSLNHQASKKSTAQKTVKVGIMSGDKQDQEVWKSVAKTAKEKYDLKLKFVYFSDYNQPNEALLSGDIDVNAFQSYNYVKTWNKAHKSDIVAVGNTYITPMHIYSKEVSKLSDLKEGSTVAIPNDASNESRALFVLQSAGLIKLTTSDSSKLVGLPDITENPYQLKFKEVDASQTPRALDSVALSVVNYNYATAASLPNSESVYMEPLNKTSAQYINFIAATSKEKNNKVYKEVAKAYASKATEKAIKEQYPDGGELPAWNLKL